MSTGYILFSQTSSSGGTRDSWNTGTLSNEFVLDGDLGVVGGSEQAVASSAWKNPAGSNSSTAAAYGLFADGDAQNQYESLTDIFNEGGARRVLGANGAVNAGPLIAATFTDNDGTVFHNGQWGTTFGVGLAESQWNQIKNVELFITSGDLAASGIDHVVVQNFVDTRVRLGATLLEKAFGTAAGTTLETLEAERSADRLRVDIGNAKRGEFDAPKFWQGVELNLDVWTNGAGWQNSFDLDGSRYGDVFDIDGGSKTAGAFGRGAGDGHTGLYDGRLTTLYVNLGAGDDVYSSAGKTGRGSDRTQDWQFIDNVVGGSGNDSIATGGGDDNIQGDDEDAASLGFSFGGPKGDIASEWMKGIGADLLTIANKGATEAGFTAYDGTNAARFSDQSAFGNAAGGLGVDVPGVSKAADETTGPENAEIQNNDNAHAAGNSDVLRFTFTHAVDWMYVGLSAFYADDNGPDAANGSIANGEPMETGKATLYDGDTVVGSFVFRANGTYAIQSGSDPDLIVRTLVLDNDGNAVDPGSAGNINDGISYGRFQIRILGVTFDRIDIESNGVKDYGTAAAVNQDGEVSDFYVRDLSIMLAETAGNDTIDAGSGDDTITGGGGDDDLTGGKGSDKFIFNDGDGADVIRDFTRADQLLLEKGEAITQTLTAAGLEITHGSDGDTLLLEGVNHTLHDAGDSGIYDIFIL